MRPPTLIALLAALIGTLLSACGSSRGESLLDKKTWVVGVRPDLPGLGLRRPDGTFEGFDIDVARHIARDLGRTVAFVPVLAADRIPALEAKKADLVLATLSVTPERKTRIAFAGPYLTSYQDVLVRAGMPGVTGLRDLKGRRFCAVEGADPATRLLAVRGMTATLVPAQDYDRCMALMRSNGVDAITTNDVILAGLAKRAGGECGCSARRSPSRTVESEYAAATRTAARRSTAPSPACTRTGPPRNCCANGSAAPGSTGAPSSRCPSSRAACERRRRRAPSHGRPPVESSRSVPCDRHTPSSALPSPCPRTGSNSARVAGISVITRNAGRPC
ncbi:transporter substrate-binding domain-containing protein [Actinomadura keratinilytica]|uniref:transporter substrate-binding domain-containing protein n=1 Tax=Actinomadura keratinilytica TaxID=547461 RepID=UPI00360A7393